MKKQQFLLIYAIIGYCFAQSSIDDCTTGFENILKTKCEAFSTCSFTNLNDYPSCKNNDCSLGNGDSTICSKTVHKDFPKIKCEYNTANDICEAVEAKCSGYSFINGIRLTKEDCSKLKPDVDDGKHYCGLSNSQDFPACTSYYKKCGDITTGSSNCNSNIPNISTQKCIFEDNTCKNVERKCDNAIYNINKDDCNNIKPTDALTQKCVYDNNQCLKQYISCSSYNPSNCEGQHPLIDNGNDYDYKYKCILVNRNGNQICEKDLIECELYDGNDDSICSGLKVKDSLKRCIYSPHRDTSGITHICKEVYKTCEGYNDNVIEKNKSGCESIKPIDDNEECVFIPGEDKCVKRVIYSNCDTYDGSDKRICESIVSPNTNSYCVLEKDSKCKERSLLCHEAFNINDCLYVAKASDNNKRCAFGITPTSNGDNVCYEEYINCENYLENNIGTCEAIKLYDGKKCKYELERCRTKDKICQNAKTKEECKFIAQTGVSDPDKKVCQYNENSYQCEENYKYCSDYRGADSTICKNIKPYDESGNNIDVTSKCEYDSNVGCHRIPEECNKADGNPILCALISPKIKDNRLKYCAYINNRCIEHFKTCENYQEPSTISCEDTVPENYLSRVCETKFDSTTQQNKCVQKKDCTLFQIAHSETLCHQVSHNCEYEGSICVTKKKTCNETKFYTFSDENEEICKSIEASKVYKSCILKEDLSGCEEIYNNSIYANLNTNSETEGNSSGFITMGIEFIIVMLSLLI